MNKSNNSSGFKSVFCPKKEEKPLGQFNKTVFHSIFLVPKSIILNILENVTTDKDREENANKIKVSFSGKVNILCFYVRLNFAIIKGIVYSFTQFGFRF